MAKKQVRMSRSDGGKKKKPAKDDDDDDDDDDMAILELYSKENSRIEKMKLLPLLLVIVVAFLWKDSVMAESIDGSLDIDGNLGIDSSLDNDGSLDIDGNLDRIFNTGSNKTTKTTPSVPEEKIKHVNPISNDGKISLKEFASIACDEEAELIWCPRGLFDFDDDDGTRSIRSRKTGKKNDVLAPKSVKALEIPSSVQIKMIDALRDPYVNSLLRKSHVHSWSGKPLKPVAYLTVKIALELSRFRNRNPLTSIETGIDRLHNAWFNFMPTYEDFYRYHPVARKMQELFKDGGDLEQPQSLIDLEVEMKARTGVSEYASFSSMSPDFTNLFSFEDWIAAYLICETRIFNFVPPTLEDIDEDEMESYVPFFTAEDDTEFDSERLRKDFMHVRLAPLMDSFEHSSKPSLTWQPWTEKDSPIAKEGSYVMAAHRDIEYDSDITTMYFVEDQKTDQSVFAEYGFANTKGDTKRSALLANHYVDGQDKFEFGFMGDSADLEGDVLNYLGYADGYESCHPMFDSSNTSGSRRAFETVRAKSVLSMLPIKQAWTVSLPRGRVRAKDIEKMQFFKACRMMATTQRDFGGHAFEILKSLLAGRLVQGSIKSTEDLDYRTWHVMERLSKNRREELPKSMEPFFPHDSISLLNNIKSSELHRILESGEIDINSWEGQNLWVRLSEMEVLDILIEISETQKKKLLDSKELRIANGEIIDEMDYLVRYENCG